MQPNHSTWLSSNAFNPAALPEIPQLEEESIDVTPQEMSNDDLSDNDDNSASQQ